MASLQTIRIDASAAALTPEQKRFNTLIRQIAQSREMLAAWQRGVGEFRPVHAARLGPLRAEFRALCRRQVIEMDGISGRGGWSRAERDTLSDLIREGAGNLLASGDDDEELDKIFSRHADVDFGTERGEALLALKEMTEATMGIDLGADGEIRDEEDLIRRMQAGLEQRMQAEQVEREARAGRKRKTPAQQQREAEATQALQSVREVFRKLASALHPDRETDAEQRAAKTALMQRANQAYEANDLLALLELQLEIEQIDASHIAGADAPRLKRYNKVLAEQLKELKGEIEHEEMMFRLEFSIDLPGRLDPRKLVGQVLEFEYIGLQVAIVDVEQEVALLADVRATRRWLKVQRQRLDHEASDDDFPF